MSLLYSALNSLFSGLLFALTSGWKVHADITDCWIVGLVFSNFGVWTGLTCEMMALLMSILAQLISTFPVFSFFFVKRVCIPYKCEFLRGPCFLFPCIVWCYYDYYWSSMFCNAGSTTQHCICRSVYTTFIFSWFGKSWLFVFSFFSSVLSLNGFRTICV